MNGVASNWVDGETGKNVTSLPPAPTKVGRVLDRQIFTTSRLADFASRSELERQIGHSAPFWPEVVLKEMVDNALDACEAAGAAPRIKIEVDQDHIIVADNGGGISPETIDRIIDYNFKTSSNLAYRSPTRGAQGNALQTLLAMAHALTGHAGVTVIESRGIRHRITFSINPISREPVLDLERAEIHAAPGTRISVLLATTPDVHAALYNTASDFTWTNPHLTLSFVDTVSATSFDNEATDHGWQKWKPTNPTSAHWYDLGSLKTLIAAEVNWAQRGDSPQRPVRDFIADFRGLAGTGKRRQICEAISASRESLDTYFYRGDDAVNRLLKEMKAASKSVKPRDLGVIGEEHILASLGGDPVRRSGRGWRTRR